MALLLAGCLVRAKQQTAKYTPPAPQPVPKAEPAPASAPLSTPQTQVELPPPQPLNPDAVAAAEAPGEPPEPPSPPPRNTGAARRGTAGPPAIPPPKPEPEAAAPAAAAPTPPENSARIQEILPASEQKRFQELADARKREIRQWLEQAGARRLTRSQAGLKRTVESYVKLSDQAEAQGDMRQASEVAERAWILAKDLQGGR
jgi:hypothetical protein